MNVTTLGSDAGGAARSVGNIVNYLEGNTPTADHQLSREGSSGGELDTSGPGNYYADSGAGRWLGVGTEGAGFGLSGSVDREAFERLLLGADPNTGERLMHSRGVSARANSTPETGADASKVRSKSGEGASQGASTNHPNRVSAPELAASLGVDHSYIRKIIRRTCEEITGQDAARAGGLPVPELSATHLRATKEGVTWTIEAAEAERFAASRKPQQVIHGYDVTFSVPKSVSVLWAASLPEVQAVIETGFTEAVNAGMAYLEDEGFWIREGRGQQAGGAMTAAAYRHHTSRAFEPQLHDHVVVPNLAFTGGGDARAVDARGFMAHATPAGHLADAALRNYLSAELGVAWTDVEKGSAEIVGVPNEAMRAMSSRRAAVVDLAEEIGAFTTKGRQTAALMTRPGKDDGVDPVELADGWRTTLAEHGLTPELATEITAGRGQPMTAALTVAETAELFTKMSSKEGVTKYASVFDRRDVIAYVADKVGGRIETSEIGRLTDSWLAAAAVPLELSNSWQSIGNPGARVALSHDTVYSTPEMVRIEQRVLALHRAGLNQGGIQLQPAAVESSIRRLERNLGAELGVDQAAAVRAITLSGHQYQSVQGLAGSGKTTAMRAAVQAWETAGYTVIGAAPFGAAARKLGEEIGTETRTVESLVQYMGHNGPANVLDARTVVLVDEGSTISTRQLGALYHAANQSGATLRIVGDPQQHSAVEAGGLWNALIDLNQATTPVLDINRRQDPETLAVVREALETYRTGEIGDALETLSGDGRIATADTWPELLDRLACDWLPHHLNAVDDGRAPTQMVAERNRDRAELNSRAQQLLTDRGVLGHGVEIGDSTFHLGDRVVAQQQNPDLRRHDSRSHRDHVLNGSQGTVIAFDGSSDAPDVVVDFDGLGVIAVPNRFVDHEVGGGRGGGLAPAYAVTSYKAEGQTYDAALGLAVPGAIDAPGMYVTLTRGRTDLTIYSIDPNQTPQRIDAEMPTTADQRTMTAALRDSLTKPERPAVASVADAGVAAAIDSLTPTERGQAITEARVAGHAIANPDPTQIAAFGERPHRPGPHQELWDQAVAAQAIYTDRYPTTGRTINAEPIPVTAPQLNADHDTDHQSMTQATRQARRAALASTPLDDLLEERSDRAGTSADHHQRRLTITATHAEQDLANAELRYDQAERLVNSSGPLIPPPPGAAAQLEQARTARDIANARLINARQQLASFARGEQPAAARSQLIEDALTWRISAATKQPARYIIDAIGTRPPHTGAGQWDKTAHLIERVRHNHGLTPNHGPQPGTTPLERAVGTPNTRWEPLTRSINALTNQPTTPERLNTPQARR